AWMSVAIAIWASWLVLTSTGVTTDLTPVDLAGLRTLVPAVVLAPILWRERELVARIGLGKCLLLSAYGAPFTLCVGYGLGYAPVAHAGAMVPSLMPVAVAAVGFLVLGQRISAPQFLSAVLIVAGASAIVLRRAQPWGSDELWVGHLLFLVGALLWACFTLTVRRHSIDPFLATAVVGAVSTLGLAPIWALSGLSSLGTASTPDIAFQLIFQGVVTGLISIFAFGRALRLLGAVATRMSALTPAAATLLAIPILSQMPDTFEIAALGLVVCGLLVASIPSRRTQTAITTPALQR
ncbi:MAG: DMT family transporter, partial [Ruegeria sp.]|nr:DMT family transporter [Ruegeria sp.]